MASSGEQSQCSKGPWRETANLSEQTSKEDSLSEAQRESANKGRELWSGRERWRASAKK
ncbi:hypothetical protein L195_g056993 [Trifolium pratense]|uniref:Uncharacterized protein n=1 Tax=Trifolium pratense TaxID=57577 RepID=A0A2K3KUH7_TRIPR|nr:hypothetical protein L195_g056993 [Trifolium pratense]